MLSRFYFLKRKTLFLFGEFWPISLCSFTNKMFTHILCDRLIPLLPSLILEEQSALLKGRDIADNILLARELMQSLHRNTMSHSVVFKFDMTKPFDRVSWCFLRQLLLKFGFHPLFVDLIANNLSSSWFSILLNGSSVGFFFPSMSSLKQEEPLSPYLFILLTEVFSLGLKNLMHASRVLSYSFPRGAPLISHLCSTNDLFYSPETIVTLLDDCLIFCIAMNVL